MRRVALLGYPLGTIGVALLAVFLFFPDRVAQAKQALPALTLVTMADYENGRTARVDANGRLQTADPRLQFQASGDGQGSLRVAQQGPVAIGNFPELQQVAGTVNVGNLPPTQNVQVTNSSLPITGSVRVTNLSTFDPASVIHGEKRFCTTTPQFQPLLSVPADYRFVLTHLFASTGASGASPALHLRARDPATGAIITLADLQLSNAGTPGSAPPFFSLSPPPSIVVPPLAIIEASADLGLAVPSEPGCPSVSLWGTLMPVGAGAG